MTNSAKNKLEQRSLTHSIVRLGVWGALILFGSFWAINAQTAASAASSQGALQLSELGAQVSDRVGELSEASIEEVSSSLSAEMKRAALEKHKAEVISLMQALEAKVGSALPESRSAIGAGVDGLRSAVADLDPKAPDSQNVTYIQGQSENLSKILRKHSRDTQEKASTIGRLAMAGAIGFGAVSFSVWLAMLVRALRRIRSHQEQARQQEALAGRCNDLIHQVAWLVRTHMDPNEVVSEFLKLWMSNGGWDVGHWVRYHEGKWIAEAAHSRNMEDCEATLTALVTSAYHADLDYLADALETQSVQWVVSKDGELVPGRFCQSDAFFVESFVVLPVFAGDQPAAILEVLSQSAKPEQEVVGHTLEVCARLIGQLFLQHSATHELGEMRDELVAWEKRIAIAEDDLAAIGSQLEIRGQELATVHEKLEHRTRELDATEKNLATAHKALERARDTAEVAARRFAELFQGVPVPCLTTGVNGQIYEWNQAAEEFLGLTATDLLERPVGEVFDLLDVGISASEVQELISSSSIDEPMEVDLHFDTGESKSAVIHVFHMRMLGRGSAGVVWSFTDLTERKAAEDRVIQSEAKLRGLIDHLTLGVFWIGRSGEVQLSNASLEDVTAWNRSRDVPLLNAFELQLFQGDDHPVSIRDNPFFRAIRCGIVTHQQSYRLNLASGERIYVSLSVAPLFDGAGKPVGAVASLTDESQQRLNEVLLLQSMETLKQQSQELETQRSKLAAANEKLELLATTDGLTGLKNHRAFQDFLDTQFKISKRQGTALSLCLMDVDEFKKYNDTFGHPEGDAVLRAVAKALMQVTRDSDMVARYGGEEFVVVLPGSGPDAAMDAAERIRAAVEALPWDLRLVTLSVGVATMTSQTKSRENLIMAADAALYASKRNGRNRVTFAQNELPAA